MVDKLELSLAYETLNSAGFKLLSCLLFCSFLLSSDHRFNIFIVIRWSSSKCRKCGKVGKALTNQNCICEVVTSS
jgi:hypothetical protein